MMLLRLDRENVVLRKTLQMTLEQCVHYGKTGDTLSGEGQRSNEEWEKWSCGKVSLLKQTTTKQLFKLQLACILLSRAK